MSEREYIGPNRETAERHFSDGTWRQPLVFLRDMAKYPTTAARLAALRATYPAPTSRPGWTYDRHSCVGDPAYWFGREGGTTVNREDGAQTLNYGAGLGAEDETARQRPFRYLGYADETLRGIGHSGWYADEFGDTLYRGTVFQLPARKGETLYLPGAEWGEDGRGGFSPGGGFVDFSETYETAEDAARAADEVARVAAEREREYREAEAAADAEAEADSEAARIERLAGHIESANLSLRGSGYMLAADEDGTLSLTSEEGESL